MNVLDEIKLLTTAVFLLFATAIMGQSLDSIQRLPEIVITERLSDNEIRSTAPLQVLSGKVLENMQVLNVSDAIKHFSGVNVRDYGGIGGLKTVSVRSLGANHTAINYNGISVSDVQTGQIDIGRFSLENIDLLSINNGQSDQIFQPARSFSSASVVNITSVSPSFSGDVRINGKASVKGGSFGLFNPSVYSNIKINDILSGSFSAEFLKANGKYPYTLQYGNAGKDSSSIEQRQNTDVKNLRLEGALYASLSNNTKGNFRLYYYNSERGLPGATIFYNTESFSKQRLWDNTFFTQAHFEHSFSRKVVVQANAKYNYGYLRYVDPTFLNSEGFLENEYKQYERYGSIALLFRAFENISFSASNDISHNSMLSNKAGFVSPTRWTSQSVVAAKYVDNHVLATSSLLYTHTSDLMNGSSKLYHNRLSPFVSISVKPFENSDLRFRGFYKNIFRMPTFNDIFYSIVGERDLKPEDTQQFNLGVAYSNNIGEFIPLLKFTADAYYNTVQNKIIAIPVRNMFEWSMVNYGEVTIKGLDLSMESSIKLSNKSNLLIGSSYTYQQALNTSDESSSIYLHQIPYTPKLSGSGRALLETVWVNIGYSILWSGARYSSSQNSPDNRISGFTDHSASISKSINSPMGLITLNLEALNLTDNNYQIVKNFPMPGRSFRATLSIKF